MRHPFPALRVLPGPQDRKDLPRRTRHRGRSQAGLQAATHCLGLGLGLGLGLACVGSHGALTRTHIPSIVAHLGTVNVVDVGVKCPC